MSDYIKTVEIEGLLGDENSIFKWELNPNVNILAGANGSGKSTVLQAIFCAFLGELNEKMPKVAYLNRIKLDMNNAAWSYWQNEKLKVLQTNLFQKNGDFHFLDTAYFSMLETALPDTIELQVFSNKRIKTQLDWKVAKAESVLNVYMAKKAALFNKGQKTNNTEQVFEKYNLFLDLLDQSFNVLGKNIDRDYIGFQVIDKKGKKLHFTELSTGEKQLFCLYVYTLTTDLQQPILIFDEPELSLNMDWQEKLIDNLLLLNPNAQIIIATHSPYILGLKWSLPKYVFQMEELLTQKETNDAQIN